MLENTYNYLNHLSNSICESCRQAKSSLLIINTDTPLLICEECAFYLENNALSPREWYNLVVIHREIKNLLDYSHYYKDGEAVAPQIRRLLNKDDQLPVLESCKDNEEQLLELCYFPFSSPQETSDIFLAAANIPAQNILEYLDGCIGLKPRSNVLSQSYTIYEHVVQRKSTDWLRGQWSTHAEIAYENNALDALVSASLVSFSKEELLELAQPLLEKHPDAAKSFFPYPEYQALTLYWLENHLTPPYTYWSTVAVGLNLPWHKLEQWIKQGRPMSLLALSTLSTLVNKQGQFVLTNPASIEEMTKVLTQYETIDSTPNVRNMVARIVSHWETILNKVTRKPQPLIESPYSGLRRIHKTTQIQSLCIKQFIPYQDLGVLATKFGGQPDGIDEETWPLSSFTGQPLVFLGQVYIDPELFGALSATMAYIFWDEEDELIYSEERAFNSTELVTVILQSKPSSHKPSSYKGPTINEQSFGILTQLTAEPDYLPDYAWILKERPEREQHLKSPPFSKIAGLPCFLQNEEYPPACKEWNLLLQLDSGELPFEIEPYFESTFYIFISPDGSIAQGVMQNT